ncbi:MAG: NRDE family protein [Pseudomonadota bacterium]
MCLALIAWQSHPDYPLVVAANRDEFYTRATRPAAWWGQAVSLLAGRDEEAGGTWLGINRRGRFALLTNVRAPSERNPHAPTRGALVVSALQSGAPLGPWLQNLAARSHVYNGFNLLVGEALGAPGRGRGPELHYHSNRLGEPPRQLDPGIYGLSNAFLDTPWPKVTRAVGRFACQLASRVDADALLALMADRALAPDRALPSTGVPLEWERVLSAIQIRANGYGTRTTTVITVRSDGLVGFVERTFDSEDPERHTDRRYEFVIGAAEGLISRLRTRADDV